MFFFSYSSFASDYEVEFFVTVDDRDLDVMEFSDEITLRQFKNNANWKDNAGNYGVVECMGNHTVFKSERTLLKMYCKEINKSNDNFVIMFERDTENLNVGVGKSTYIHAEGKFKNFKNTKCIYAVNTFENKGSIIKQKCKLE
tara:strand:+ start:189 stop:617 length:429 start_codon:yes stop_codon:yes gene_type:complete